MALTTNITAYWKLDEASWNAADSVWTSTWVNVWTIGFATGKIWNGITNNYTNDKYLSCGTNVINGAETSISLWFKIPSANTQVSNLFTIMGNNTNERILIWVSAASAGKINVYAVNKSPQWRHTGTTSVNDWNRHHIVVVYASATVKVYLDWNTWTPEVNVSSSWSLATSGLGIYIGGRYYSVSTDSFNWNIDEVWVRDRVLTTAEVTQLYNGGAWLTYPFVSTNIKSANGVLKNNIKSKNDTVNANIKSRNWVA